MFYKYENDTLTSGPVVMSAEYVLVEDELSTYSLPVDGWYWFDTDEEANQHYGITD